MSVTTNDKDQMPSTRDCVFKFIVDYKRENDGLAPAFKTIAEALYLNTSTVRYHLHMLERDGRIQVLGRRSIRVIGGSWGLPDENAIT